MCDSRDVIDLVQQFLAFDPGYVVVVSNCSSARMHIYTPYSLHIFSLTIMGK